MTTAAGEPWKRQRNDAAAKRARVLDAATVEFRTAGRQASLEAVARRAGVGIGTLYRHFASREALAAAVYRHETDQLVRLATELEADTDPVLALRTWLRATTAFVATKKGMADALALAVRMPAELTEYSSDQLTGPVDRLLLRATEGRSARPRLQAQEVLRMLVALCYEWDAPEWRETVDRLLDVFVDGLCAAPTNS